LLNKAPSSQL